MSDDFDDINEAVSPHTLGRSKNVLFTAFKVCNKNTWLEKLTNQKPCDFSVEHREKGGFEKCIFKIFRRRLLADFADGFVATRPMMTPISDFHLVQSSLKLQC